MKAYVYKILFIDGSWYYGFRRLRKDQPESDGYYGSPVTNKKHWDLPHSKIVLGVFEDPKEAAKYEVSLIRESLNDPKCLNECANLTFSLTVNQMAREKAAKLRRGSKLSKSHKENISKAHKGKQVTEKEKERLRTATLGFSWWNDGVTEICCKEKMEHPWKRGRLKGCFGKSSRTSGWKWYNDGSTSKMFKEPPGEGWKEGRIRPKGKRWYNDGTINKMFVNPPEGWTLGRIRR